jgi:hypothetical protein
MIADEAGLQVGGMLDKAGPVGNAMPEGMLKTNVLDSQFSSTLIQHNKRQQTTIRNVT